MKKTIVIDSRMINNSGIGIYLQNIIGILSLHFNLILLGEESELKNYKNFCKVTLFTPPIFSLREQILLPFIIPKCDIFWSPHYNIPFFPIRTKKRVVTLHDAYYFAFYHTLSVTQKIYIKIASKICSRFAKKIFTVSEFSKSELIRHIHCPSQKIEIVYNGVAKNYNSEFHFNKIDTPYILFVGNVKPHKNLVNALSSFKILLAKYPEVKFFIVGKKEGFITSETRLTSLIETFKDSVVFTGYVSIEELKNYYANAKVFLFPSLYEGFGIPILEAMKFNIPIVSSNLASIPEVGGDAVLYCDPTNVPDMAEKLEQAYSGKWKPDLEKYKNQVEKYSWESVAEKHITILMNL